MRFNLPLWKVAPFLRLLLPAVIGIISGWYFPFSIGLLLVIFVSCFCCFACLHFFSPAFLYRWHLLPGILLFLSLYSIFYALTLKANPASDKLWYGRIQNLGAIECVIKTRPQLKGGFYRMEADVAGVFEDSVYRQTSGMLYLYLQEDSVSEIPKPGYRLILKAKLQPVKNSGNPGSFDYAKYCALQGIYHTVFARKEDWKILLRNKPGALSAFVDELRQYSLFCIRKYLPPNKDIQGIAEALVVGYKGDLDKDLLQSYSNTGVVHIIAISGLHLALVYYILSLLISKIPGLRKKVGIQSLLCMVCLWLFSLVSGASPSVLRSAVMFSFVLTGKSFGYKGSIANSLACSAFFLLMYNPYFLWDMGFQLSYLAVIGIVSMQEPMYRLLYFKNRIARYLWKASTVSLSAQMATLPFCLYYFHRFPNYFLLANLVAVPLSSTILVVEFFLIAFSWVPPFAIFSGKVAGWLLILMNGFILFIERLPGSASTGIFFPVITFVFVGLCILFFGIALHKKIFQYFIFAACSLFIAIIFSTIFVFNIRREPVFIVYNTPRHFSVDFLQNGKYVNWGDSIIDEKIANRYVWEPARISFASTKRVGSSNFLWKNKLVRFHEKNILWVDSEAAIPYNSGKLDILIISHNVSANMDSIFRKLLPGIVVFDASNNLWKIAKWKSICDRLALPCFSVPEQGAFIYFPLRK